MSMLGSMWASASGMRASSLLLDTTAHNLANINTWGFRRHGLNFSELAQVQLHQMSVQPLYQRVPLSPETALVPLGRGHGVHTVGTEIAQEQAPLVATGRPSDLAVEGTGYLLLGDADGQVLGCARSRTFHHDPEGHMVDAAGRFLMLDTGERLRVPPGAAGSPTVSPDGVVSIVGGEDGETRTLGQLHLAVPRDGGAVRPPGDGLYDLEGMDILAPGETGFIRQGYLEASNVDLAQEMMNLILAQRAFQLNGRVLQTADQMLDLASTMRR